MEVYDRELAKPDKDELLRVCNLRQDRREPTALAQEMWPVLNVFIKDGTLAPSLAISYFISALDEELQTSMRQLQQECPPGEQRSCVKLM